MVAPAAFKRDLECADSAAVLCTLDMTLMSMSWVLHRHGVHTACLVVWATATAIHLLLMVITMPFVYKTANARASAQPLVLRHQDPWVHIGAYSAYIGSILYRWYIGSISYSCTH